MPKIIFTKAAWPVVNKNKNKNNNNNDNDNNKRTTIKVDQMIN